VFTNVLEKPASYIFRAEEAALESTISDTGNGGQALKTETTRSAKTFVPVH
jgi:hypothetical protein